MLHTCSPDYCRKAHVCIQAKVANEVLKVSLVFCYGHRAVEDRVLVGRRQHLVAVGLDDQAAGIRKVALDFRRLVPSDGLDFDVISVVWSIHRSRDEHKSRNGGTRHCRNHLDLVEVGACLKCSGILQIL